MSEESDYYQIVNRKGEIVGRIKRGEFDSSNIHQKESSLTAIITVKTKKEEKSQWLELTGIQVSESSLFVLFVCVCVCLFV
jgi:hypothetical protein